MTKDEAIKYLIRPICTCTVLSKEIEKQFQAYEMAIEALRKESDVHAHWNEFSDYTGTFYAECSRCGLLWWIEEGTAEENEMFYCPKCGAKMDGKEGKE